MSEPEETDSEWEEQNIIIDNGSGVMKCGFGGEELPRMAFPSIVGKPRHKGVMIGMGRKDHYVGDEALAKKAILKFSNPIEYGYFTNWDDMERIWQHTFYNELRIAPDENNVLLTDKIVDQKPINREKITQIMFETFEVPNYYIAYQSVLALYATGTITGISIDCGYSTTYCVPIFEGCPLKHAVQSNDIGGKDVSNYLKKILLSNALFDGNKDLSDTMLIHLDDIKHEKELFYVKTFPHLSQYNVQQYTISGYLRNYTKFNVNSNLVSNDIMDLCYKFYDDKLNKLFYTLPDGTKIHFNEYEKTQCVECIFNPSLLSDKNKPKEIIGIVELCDDAINKSDDKIKQTLRENIIVHGGNSMFDGIDERVEIELRKLQKSDSSISDGCIVKMHPQYMTWIGGSILSMVESFNNMWITKDQYDETGPTIVHKKCV